MIKRIKNSFYFSFKTKITLVSFLSFVFFFNIWRLIFFYSYLNEFNGTTGLYIQSFFVGLQSDFFMSAIFSLPIFIASHIPQIKFNSKTKFAYYSYLLILYVTIGFLNVVDLEFFKELGAHINMMAQMYGFDTGGENGEVWMQVWVSYPVFSYLFMIFFLTFLTYKIVKHNLTKSLFRSSKKEPVYIKYIIITLFLILSSNAFQKNPFNPKKSFFSKTDMMANHLAVNSIQNYIFSLTTTPNLIFYENNIANEITIKERESNLIQNNVPNPNFNSPNIVLIILESHVGAYTNYINTELNENLTPFLDSLSLEGINFKNCYANGNRTAYGLSAILCSWPVIPGYPLMRTEHYQDSNHKNPETFSSILKNLDNNYNNIFMYGGDSNFDEMKLFAESNRFDLIVDHTQDLELKKLSLDNFDEGVNPWGVFDHHLFDRSIEIISESHAKKQPTFITILSTTNHLPWIIPNKYRDKISKFESNKKDFNLAKNTIQYVDHSLKLFFDAAQKKDWFDNTIFILTADHGLNIYNEHINDPRNARIPFIIYNRNIEAQEIKKTISQIDILPTLLDLIHKDNNFKNPTLFGCSGFDGGDGFAFRGNDNNIQWIENEYVYSYNIGIDFEEFYLLDNFQTNRIDSIFKKEYEKKCKAYAQTAYTRIEEEKRDLK